MAVVFAMAMPLVIGGVAFGVETAYWYSQQLKLQEAADAASYAGAVDQRAGKPYATVAASALAAAGQNSFDPATGTIQVNTPPATGGFTNTNSVEVLLTRREQRFFTQIFSTEPVISRARAVSTFTTASNACVLALDPIASRAAQFSGASSTTFTGCTVMANSLAADAVYVQGSASLTTPCVLTSGGVDANGGLTETSCIAPVTNLPPVGDPLRSLPEPSDTGACLGGGAALQPGRYCGGLSLSGNVSLSPGTYVISGGTLKINANANVTGSGVTIYFTDNATISINGNATVNLSAPSTGTYSGILMFAAREYAGGIDKFNGTAASQITGTLYFPTQEVDYLGNFSGANGCTHIVAGVVQWSGSTTVSVDCSAYAMADLQVGAPVKLVE